MVNKGDRKGDQGTKGIMADSVTDRKEEIPFVRHCQTPFVLWASWEVGNDLIQVVKLTIQVVKVVMDEGAG